MKILAIETSCDETAASVAQDNGFGVEILSNVVSSQIDIHAKYGGVVPEVAAREHVLNILPVVDQALSEAGLDGGVGLDAIAVTRGPGLMSSLQTGVETAKSLAFVWELPLIAVNHIEGHIYANHVDLKKEIELPAIILTVSGGHTMINLMKEFGKLEILGETRDDAAGEAFDKAAKLMNLGYPGGPIISAKAEEFQISNFKFQINPLPRPMLNSGDYDFSFSGLKTAIRYAIRDDKDWQEKVDAYCYEIQEAIVDTLVTKTVKAAKEYKARTVMLAGGVAANKRLREVLAEKVGEKLENVDFIMPNLTYTTDNAAMIAAAAIYKAKRKEFSDWRGMTADCNMEVAR